MSGITREQVEREEQEYRAERETLDKMRDRLLENKIALGIKIFADKGVNVGDKCRVIKEGASFKFDKVALFMGYECVSKYSLRVNPILKKVKKDGTPSVFNAWVPYDHDIAPLEGDSE